MRNQYFKVFFFISIIHAPRQWPQSARMHVFRVSTGPGCDGKQTRIRFVGSGVGQKVLVAGGDKNSFLCKIFHIHVRSGSCRRSSTKKERAPKFQILGCLDLRMLKLCRELNHFNHQFKNSCIHDKDFYIFYLCQIQSFYILTTGSSFCILPVDVSTVQINFANGQYRKNSLECACPLTILYHALLQKYLSS